MYVFKRLGAFVSPMTLPLAFKQQYPLISVHLKKNKNQPNTIQLPPKKPRTPTPLKTQNLKAGY